MRKKSVQPIRTQFDPTTQPGYQSRFGNFAFNRFFGDLQMTKTPEKKPVAPTAKVISDEQFYGSRQLPQTLPSRAYKKGKTP